MRLPRSRQFSAVLLFPCLLAAAEPAIPKLDSATRAEVIRQAVRHLNESYVFPETAKKMEAAISARLEAGDYDNSTDGAEFARILTEHLREVSHDRHLSLRYSAKPLPPEPTNPREPGPDELARMRSAMAANNFGFNRVERLPGNIGYLEFNFFGPKAEIAKTVEAAFNFLGHTDALIIDLRKNGGGHPEGVAHIISYLYDGPRVHLNDIWERPTNKTEEFWTDPTVPGLRFAAKPIWVLTSKRTFSGAEEFSYNLKNLKRATLVGETTGGGAHPTMGRRLDDHFMLYVPFARAINPITKTNWEGTGVTPDIPVPAAQALHVAQIAALQSALINNPDPDRKPNLEKEFTRLQSELATLQSPPNEELP